MQEHGLMGLFILTGMHYYKNRLVVMRDVFSQWRFTVKPQLLCGNADTIEKTATDGGYCLHQCKTIPVVVLIDVTTVISIYLVGIYFTSYEVVN